LRFNMMAITLGAESMESFDAEEFLKLVEKHKITQSAAGADHVRAHAETSGRSAPALRRLVLRRDHAAAPARSTSKPK